MKKSIILSIAAALLSAYAFGQATSQPKGPEYEFKVIKENGITPVKNQYRSGTCWCYSGIGFIESEVLRQTGKEVDLSEMFVVSKSYHDRAVKYVRLDGHLNFAAGSSFGDVFEVVKKYGIVPQEAYPGMQYGTELPVQAEMDAALLGYVKAIASNPNRELSTAWQKGLDGILQAYQGAWPESFQADGISYTPESYRDALGINVDDFVNICSFASEPLYEPHVIEVCDNWRWGSAYNVTMDEMMDIMYNAIEKGFTIAWGADVSEKGFTRDGIATCPVQEPKKKVAAGSDQEHWLGKDNAKPEEPEVTAIPEEIKVTDEMRQDAYDRKKTTDDHGMQLYGIAEDQNGTRYFMMKNSWGDTGKYKGLWYVSDTYVRYKTLNFIIHKDALPKDMKKKLGIK